MTYHLQMGHRMLNRADFLRRLHESSEYRNALSHARSDDERKAVAAFVNEFVGGFADVLGPLIERATHDPAFAAQLGQAVAERRQVVTDARPVVSGSHGQE